MRLYCCQEPQILRLPTELLHLVVYEHLLPSFYVRMGNQLRFFGFQSFFSTCKHFSNLKFTWNPCRMIILPCQVWIKQLRVRHCVAFNVPTPTYYAHVPGHGWQLLGVDPHGQVWHSMYNLVRRHGFINYIFPPSQTRPSWSRPPAAFMTEFEDSVPYFQGQIGLLKLQTPSYSYVPWCPSYPDNLYDSDDSDSEDDEFDHEFDNDEEAYLAELHQHDP